MATYAKAPAGAWPAPVVLNMDEGEPDVLAPLRMGGITIGGDCIVADFWCVWCDRPFRLVTAKNELTTIQGEHAARCRTRKE